MNELERLKKRLDFKTEDTNDVREAVENRLLNIPGHTDQTREQTKSRMMVLDANMVSARAFMTNAQHASDLSTDEAKTAFNNKVENISGRSNKSRRNHMANMHEYSQQIRSRLEQREMLRNQVHFGNRSAAEKEVLAYTLLMQELDNAQYQYMYRENFIKTFGKKDTAEEEEIRTERHKCLVKKATLICDFEQKHTLSPEHRTTINRFKEDINKEAGCDLCGALAQSEEDYILHGFTNTADTRKAHAMIARSETHEDTTGRAAYLSKNSDHVSYRVNKVGEYHVRFKKYYNAYISEELNGDVGRRAEKDPRGLFLQTLRPVFFDADGNVLPKYAEDDQLNKAEIKAYLLNDQKGLAKYVENLIKRVEKSRTLSVYINEKDLNSEKSMHAFDSRWSASFGPLHQVQNLGAGISHVMEGIAGKAYEKETGTDKNALSSYLNTFKNRNAMFYFLTSARFGEHNLAASGDSKNGEVGYGNGNFYTSRVNLDRQYGYALEELQRAKADGDEEAIAEAQEGLSHYKDTHGKHRFREQYRTLVGVHDEKYRAQIDAYKADPSNTPYPYLAYRYFYGVGEQENRPREDQLNAYHDLHQRKYEQTAHKSLCKMAEDLMKQNKKSENTEFERKYLWLMNCGDVTSSSFGAYSLIPNADVKVNKEFMEAYKNRATAPAEFMKYLEQSMEVVLKAPAQAKALPRYGTGQYTRFFRINQMWTTLIKDPQIAAMISPAKLRILKTKIALFVRYDNYNENMSKYRLFGQNEMKEAAEEFLKQFNDTTDYMNCMQEIKNMTGENFKDYVRYFDITKPVGDMTMKSVKPVEAQPAQK